MLHYTLGSFLSKSCLASGRRRVITAAVKEVHETSVPLFRTTKSDPSKHDIDDLTRIYTVPDPVVTLLHQQLPIEIRKRITVFNEFGILVRKPALELISYLEQTDFTKSINKYILYGKEGVGKTTILLHLLHYGLARNFILLHLPWVANWFRFAKEVVQSTTNPDLLDIPQDAEKWLTYFKNLNQVSLSQYNLKISKDYTWSQREMSKAGEPLIDFIEFGIQRNKYSCDVLIALVNELKLASTAGKCKTLVIIDGFNAFTSSVTLLRDETRKCVPPERISITSAFFESVNYDWCNGAAILTVDTRANKDKRESHYPAYLLGKKGFEYLDPFLPICIENYSIDEFQAIIEYYKDRKWIRDISPRAEREYEMLCNKNPMEIWNFSKPL